MTPCRRGASQSGGGQHGAEDHRADDDTTRCRREPVDDEGDDAGRQVCIHDARRGPGLGRDGVVWKPPGRGGWRRWRLPVALRGRNRALRGRNRALRGRDCALGGRGALGRSRHRIPPSPASRAPHRVRIVGRAARGNPIQRQRRPGDRPGLGRLPALRSLGVRVELRAAFRLDDESVTCSRGPRGESTKGPSCRISCWRNDGFMPSSLLFPPAHTLEQDSRNANSTGEDRRACAQAARTSAVAPPARGHAARGGDPQGARAAQDR